jgi:uroporphyrinogen-III synthase
MAKNETPLIFSTRNLNKQLQDNLTAAGLAYAEKDFIKVSHDFEDEVIKEGLTNKKSQARIFTSKNAVISLKNFLQENPLPLQAKKTFTVGIKATEMLQNLGIESAARASNAIILAQIIARNAEIEEVDFFCGDQALDDLPEYLESKKIKVNRVVVYHTQLVQEKVDTENIKGLIFLSPTAVFSFYKKNKVDPTIPTFCIGATTGEAVRLRCDNPRILANEPSKESVIEKVIEYFKNK